MKRVVWIVCVLGGVVAAAFAGGQKDGAAPDPSAPFRITVMTTAYSTDPIKSDAEAIRRVNEYCGVDLKIIHVPSTSYDDKMNLTMASGDMPMVMLAQKRTASIANAVTQGAFWEIGPYLREYSNLRQANPIVLWNSSFQGKTYGLYRARPLGRNGVIYRSDWLKKVGMAEPKTIDEFYRMLDAFTNDDPDGNGKDDTYGMVLSKYMGPFDQMVTWFGGPNEWGVNAAGSLEPAFMTAAYKATLLFFKKLYDQGLVNKDFAVFDASKWSEPLISGKGGVAIDVTDRANKINEEFERNVPGAYMEIMSPPSGPKGQRSLATSGYSGFFLFSKLSIRDEAALKRVLGFFDKLGDAEMLDLCGYGIEGRHYTLADGHIKPKPSTDTSFQRNEINDLNQILAFIPSMTGTPLFQKPWIAKGQEVQAYNEKIVVGNPAAPFVSNTYAMKGAQLDNIINDARVKYIVGQVDDAGWDDAVALWKKMGGLEVMAEYNADYQRYGAKK